MDEEKLTRKLKIPILFVKKTQCETNIFGDVIYYYSKSKI